MDIENIKIARRDLADACSRLYDEKDIKYKVMFVIADMMVVYLDSLLYETKEKILNQSK